MNDKRRGQSADISKPRTIPNTANSLVYAFPCIICCAESECGNKPDADGGIFVRGINAHYAHAAGIAAGITGGKRREQPADRDYPGSVPGRKYLVVVPCARAYRNRLVHIQKQKTDSAIKRKNPPGGGFLTLSFFPSFRVPFLEHCAFYLKTLFCFVGTRFSRFSQPCPSFCHRFVIA